MISIIAAIGKNNELGKDNNLLWHLPDDLKHFKDLTMNKKIVMGTKTYYSLPKKLVGREYIILSSSLEPTEDIKVFKDFNELLKYLDNLDEEIMIVGGASIYKLFIPFAKRLYLTEIDAEKEADAFFPEFDKTKYNKKVLGIGNTGDINYSYVLYERID